MLLKLAIANDLTLELSAKGIKIGDFTWHLYEGALLSDDVLAECFYHAVGHFVSKNERT